MQLQYSDIISQKDHGHTIIYQNINTIVELHCADNFTFDIEHILENMRYLKQIADDQQLLILIYVAPYTQISPEARAFMAKADHLRFIKAEAFCIKSLAQKILASFYVKIDKPKVLVNFFENKEDAQSWLLSL